MTIIEVSINLSAGTAQVSGPISNADNVRLVLKDYAENVTDGSRVRIVRGCRELITGGTVTVSGDNGVCLLNTNSDEVKKLAESMLCPSQVGVEIVVDDTEDESVKASGRALLLLNWVEVGWSGGGTVQDGAVPITNIDELPSRYREPDMRNKINEIARVISGRAVLLTAILAPFALFGVGVNVYTAQKDQVWNDERIVTNVTFDAEGLVTSLESATNYVDSATNALSASLSEKVSYVSESSTNYTDSAVSDLDESFSYKIVEFSSEFKSYTDAATNALSAKIPVVDLAPYATKTWVQSQGYLDSGSVDGVATKEWVSQQDFLTTLALTPYATIEWVIGRGYATPSVTNGLASMKWVEAKDYAAKSWVDGKGYATPSVTNGLAGESWVMSRGFVTKSVTNGLATRTWVEKKDYATEKWVNDKGYVTKSVTNGLATRTWVEKKDYATEKWVNDKGYVTKSVTNGLATRTWVEKKDYATEKWVNDKGYVTKSVTNGLAGKTWVTSQGYVTKSITNGLAAKTWVEQKGYLPSESAKRTYATKDELDALKRMYADTNGVTRLWSEDGLTMTDGTGVVWDVTWNAITNWVSLSNRVVFAQVKDQMGFDKWVSQGIYTNALGQSSSATINFEAGVLSIFLDAHAGSTGTFEVSPGQVLVDAHDYGYNDTFSNSTVRVPAFSIRSRVVTNDVGYVTGGGGGDYLPLTGGTLTGDLSVGEDHSVARKLIVASDSQGNGITLQGGSRGSGSSVNIGGADSGGGWLNVIGGGYNGATVYIGGSQNEGGKLTVQGGGNSGGIIEVTKAGASIKKDGKEVATEAYVDTQVSGVESTLTTLAGEVNAKADAATVYTKAEVDAKVENAVLPTNPTFSNAVLSVGLNIDTNSVAVLNEIAETFGGFPIEGTATTVGGLLAALAAAVAWLRKKKIDKLTVTGMSKEVTADGGVAKLDDFFTESNSLLNGRLAYSRNATGLKDRAFNTLSFDGTEFNLSAALEAVAPTASGQPRDLLIVATATAATTISYTAGTIKGDKPTIDGAGTWLITLTEYASGVWYCRQIKMEDAA